MPKNLGSLARSLSVEEIKSLLVMKEQLIEAEARRATIEQELRKIDGEIVKLVKKLGASSPRRATSSRKPTTRRRRTRAAASTKRRTTRGKARAGAQSARGRGRGGKSLEQVIIDLIHSKGGKMLFPDIKSTIVRRKLFATRSKNFDNVLRRTISSSRKIKRVARATYTA
jgi:hypothetical protein